jgi:hypothetical protein
VYPSAQASRNPKRRQRAEAARGRTRLETERGATGDCGLAEQQGIAGRCSGRVGTMSGSGSVWSGGEVEQVSSNPRQPKSTSGAKSKLYTCHRCECAKPRNRFPAVAPTARSCQKLFPPLVKPTKSRDSALPAHRLSCLSRLHAASAQFSPPRRT